jgi:hypothetical protein
MSSSIVEATGSHFGVVAVGTVFCVYGVASVLLSITDYRSWISGMYDNNKNRKTGFGAIAHSARSYRRYIGGFGAAFLVIGIIMIVSA